jgi:CheY-like chemotaxis protein
MPGMSGIEATQALRQLEDMRGVVIIATSASVFDSDRQQSLLAGCDGFLPKPIRMETLLDLLAAKLGLRWRYAEVEPSAAGGDGAEDEAALTPPSPEALAALFELVSIGDIVGLQRQAAQLAQHDPALGPFARRLGHLAERFEVDQALALIARYLQSQQ